MVWGKDVWNPQPWIRPQAARGWGTPAGPTAWPDCRGQGCLHQPCRGRSAGSQDQVRAGAEMPSCLSQECYQQNWPLSRQSPGARAGSQAPLSIHARPSQPWLHGEEGCDHFHSSRILENNDGTLRLPFVQDRAPRRRVGQCPLSSQMSSSLAVQQPSDSSELSAQWRRQPFPHHPQPSGLSCRTALGSGRRPSCSGQGLAGTPLATTYQQSAYHQWDEMSLALHSQRWEATPKPPLECFVLKQGEELGLWLA